MVKWLYDASNHQENTPNLDGWSGLIAKASEGDWFRDGRFNQHRSNTLAAGKVFGAYHFLRSDAAVASQVDTFLSVAHPDDPVIPDVEWVKVNERVVSAPTLAQTREFIGRLRDAGRHIPMIYLPRWYWNFWGQPDISDFPPLWLSRYPDYVIRTRESGYAMVGPQPGFGGASAVLTQFTSSPLDQNAFEGTEEQLIALFRGDTDDMGTWNTPITLSADERRQADPEWDGGDVTFTPDVWTKYSSLYSGLALEATQTIKNMLAESAAREVATLTALAKIASNPSVTKETLRELINDAVKNHVKITGNIEISNVLPPAGIESAKTDS